MDRGVRPIGPWSTCTTLSSWPIPVTRTCRPGTVRAPCSSRASALIQDVVDQRRLPRPRHPRHRDEHAQRERHIHVLQIVLTRALDHHLAGTAAACAATAGTGMLSRPVRYAPVSDSWLASRSADRPGHHDVPAVLPRARADVHHPVRGADGVLIVLHHDQRVPQVPQPDQRLQQPVVIPLMQPDRRLIQHIQHPGQPRPDLGGQPDPLRLPARQRGRGPVQGQVVQADVQQERQPGADLGQDGRRDLRVRPGQVQGRQQRRPAR